MRLVIELNGHILPRHEQSTKISCSDSTINCRGRTIVRFDEINMQAPEKVLKNVNLGRCMQISLHGSLTDKDYEELLDKWLGADDTKSKRRQVACRLEEDLHYVFLFFYKL